MIKALLLLQIFVAPIAFADSGLIDLEKLSPSVKKRFLQLGADEYKSVNEFQISCDDTLVPEDFQYNSMTFEINANIEDVWNAYLTSNPKDAWSGKTLQFDFAYSKPKNSVYYRDSKDLPLAHVGMGVFIVLNIWHLKKLPAALEITKIDAATKTVQFTYLTLNTAHGRQTFYLKPLGKNKTQLVHYTYFKSDSHFRDAYLYPSIHEALLEEFHQNVMDQIGATALRVK